MLDKKDVIGIIIPDKDEFKLLDQSDFENKNINVSINTDCIGWKVAHAYKDLFDTCKLVILIGTCGSFHSNIPVGSLLNSDMLYTADKFLTSKDNIEALKKMYHGVEMELKYLPKEVISFHMVSDYVGTNSVKSNKVGLKAIKKEFKKLVRKVILDYTGKIS